MADINIPDGQPADSAGAQEGWEIRQAIEMLFFAYRDFTGDPDVILAQSGFGRAHHRVLHFVGANPGISVARLLGILRITKQSLGRVLKQLISQGFIEQHPGKQDRRQRLLFLTQKGQGFEARLAAPQQGRVSKAFAEAGPEAVRGYLRVLEHMINESERKMILDSVRRR
ncbi:MAG: MarR family winged helix-turn-helix transcriptional regulator [Pseudomonadota bacterium]|jgi:DNA-binding MarR family transcriptional regulator